MNIKISKGLFKGSVKISKGGSGKVNEKNI
jgi:hypothetical protein